MTLLQHTHGAHAAPGQGLKHGAVQAHVQKQPIPASAVGGDERCDAPTATKQAAAISRPLRRIPVMARLMMFISAISQKSGSDQER
jgi:hypothetical protein